MIIQRYIAACRESENGLCSALQFQNGKIINVVRAVFRGVESKQKGLQP